MPPAAAGWSLSISISCVRTSQPQEAGWGVASMARSAELLKHTWPGWSDDVEAAFLKRVLARGLVFFFFKRVNGAPSFKMH